MKLYVTVGLSMLAGAALLEAALIPGMVIGGAAVLAPKLQRRLRPLFGSTPHRRRADRQDVTAPPAAPAGFGIKQAIAKTITFRIIVTTLDFSTNYVVIGELATAAGLSTLNLVVGPVFYLVHETAWNSTAVFAEHGVTDIGQNRQPLATTSPSGTPCNQRANFMIVTSAYPGARISVFPRSPYN